MTARERQLLKDLEARLAATKKWPSLARRRAVQAEVNKLFGWDRYGLVEWSTQEVMKDLRSAIAAVRARLAAQRKGKRG